MAEDKERKPRPKGIKERSPAQQAKYPRNIHETLWDAWQILRREGDGRKLSEKWKISRPIIDRALNYGCVKSITLEWKISKYFNDRLDRERMKGEKLIKKALK